MLSTFTKKSDKTVNQAIHWFLTYLPLPSPRLNPNCHLVIDATYFGRKNCLIVYWDKELEHIQWFRYANSEIGYEIADDLNNLKGAGVVASSVTSDGGTGIKFAVNNIYSGIPHQRCLVHIKRHALALVTKNPRTEAGKELRPIVSAITNIKNYQERDEWLATLFSWCDIYEDFLKEKSYLIGSKRWWYTHKNLRKVRAMLLNALGDLFHYLEDSSIPRDTNGLEGRFSPLKQHYKQHRGLSKSRREAYLYWYVSVVINKEKPTRFFY